VNSSGTSFSFGLSSTPVCEFARLRWQDIDFDRELIYIRALKNWKEQTISLNSKAYGTLADIHLENTFRAGSVSAPHQR
jgi:integrase